MGSKIKVDDLAKTVAGILEEYQDATFENVKEAVDSVSKKAVQRLRVESPKRSGAYAKSWAVKKDRSTKQWFFKKIVYAQSPQYRLTHLLEKGHKVVGAKNGRTWVDARPHIKNVEQEAIEELVEEIKKKV